MGTPLPIEQASVGMADSLILMVLALVVFGPRKLPQIGRQIGKLMYEFRKASNDFKFQMEEEMRMAEDADRKKKEEAERQLTLTAQPVSAPALAAPLEDPTVEKMPEVMPPRMSAHVSEPAAGPAAETHSGLVIQPPSTGEIVAAGPVSRADVTEPVVEANIGAEDAAPSLPASTPESLPSGEAVSQHG
jgi:sec-independent protein translocase protein TatB